MIQVLISPNAFRGSLGARAVAEAIARGFRRFPESFDPICLPIADGGDDFLDVLVTARGGETREVLVNDPLGREITAPLGLLPDGTAVIEMAQASGTRRLKPHELDAAHTSSMGLGQLMAAALDFGASRLLIGLGGSATVDGGMGMLTALGAKLIDGRGEVVAPVGENLGRVVKLDLSGLHPGLKTCTLEVACDVENYLLGELGAARVFGPQKGASAKMVEYLEAGMEQWARVVGQVTGNDMATCLHGGAAGGMAACLWAVLGARLRPGIDLVLEHVHFDNCLASAKVVITGEGKIDGQTLGGKGPYGVAKRAKEMGKLVIGIGGAIPDEGSDFGVFDALFALPNKPMSLEEAMKNTDQLLQNTARHIAALLVVDRW